MFDAIDSDRPPNEDAEATPVERARARQLPARSNFAFEKIDLRDMTISFGWFEVVDHPGLAAFLDGM
ncbi:hypothetical protein XH89_10100 [Bradyrhizobium sp. CCBAU 53340]|nr:hypothetical protein XH89_10100 [Bradyrhizobium sp. CCBAU 53340]